MFQSLLFLFLTYNCQMSHQQSLPANPCPNYFNYVSSENSYFGEIQVPNDNQENLYLTVNVSMRGLYEGRPSLMLQLATSTSDVPSSQTLKFRVYFPFSNIIPKITQIQFNGRIYCTGPSEALTTNGVTNLWSRLDYFIPRRPFAVNRPISQFPQLPDLFPMSNPSKNPFTIPTVPQNDFTLSNNAFTIPNNPKFTIPTVNKVEFTIPSVNKVEFTAPTVNKVEFTAPTVGKDEFTSSNGNKGEFTPPTVGKDEFTSTNGNKVEFTPPTVGKDVFTPPNKDLTQRNPFLQPTMNETTTECGIANTIQQLVYGGTPTAEFPWLVALFHRIQNIETYQCTANLITHRHVITAAHCVRFYSAPINAIANIRLALGVRDLREWRRRAVVRGVAAVAVHPAYRYGTGHGDVAVLRMSAPVEFGVRVRPVCLWGGARGAEGWVAGWGRFENGTVSEREVRKVRMPIVAQETCLWSNGLFSNLTSRLTFCAGRADGVGGPCNGDSGAGFVMANADGVYELRGLVSLGLGKRAVCDLGQYMVFADCAKVLDFILENVRE